MRFTIHTGLERTPFELYHDKKPRTELSKRVKEGKTYLSDWSEISISASNKPKIFIYVVRDADGEITNHWSWQGPRPRKDQPTKAQNLRRRKNRLVIPLNL